MSETKSEKSPQTRRLSDDFKQDAVRLATHEKYTTAAAAKPVGVSVQPLRQWHGKATKKK